MARRNAAPNLPFPIVSGEAIFHKARGVRLIKKSWSPSTSSEYFGDIYLSPLRFVFVEHSHSARPITCPLDAIEDERVLTPFWDHEYIEFRVSSDEHGIACSYRFDFVSRADSTTDTIVKVFYLMLHYLYQLRFGPIYTTKMEENQTALDQTRNDWSLPGTPEVEDKRPTPRLERRNSKSMAVTQAFLDPESSNIVYLDLPYEPMRAAFFDPGSGNIFLAEEVLNAPTPPNCARTLSSRDVNRTLNQVRNLCTRHSIR
mmetsp:Transcript_31817/g.51371  ORF Transcript_31817/g.51371 Transcript_31817/m.51371 type:complete len:258 (+) Transcript_31817:198-971(+)